VGVGVEDGVGDGVGVGVGDAVTVEVSTLANPWVAGLAANGKEFADCKLFNKPKDISTSEPVRTVLKPL
jgi:hypothetical protein